ncbi:MAG TPA: phage tail protein [Burkholderiaceae bacterium]|nr:phage tail protein [Burkholderiaceae bacterium]
MIDALFDDHPLPAFHFAVSIGVGGLITDAAFQEVSGIGAEMTTKEFPEGGENRYVLKLPTGTKNTNLTLKRGVASLASPLVLWCKSVIEGGLGESITPRMVNVLLLDELHLPVRTWTFENAFPVKWSVAGFNAMRNEVALETIELSYTTSTRML